jgi:hypothetical protein
MFLLDGKTLTVDTAFTHNGIQYPANWLRHTTLEEKQAIGITEVAEQQRPDDRFYWVADSNDGTYNAIPKDLDVLKETNTSQVQQTAYTLLAPSDWQVIRKYERDIAIDANTATFRADVITECTRLVGAIANTSSVLLLLVKSNLIPPA